MSRKPMITREDVDRAFVQTFEYPTHWCFPSPFEHFWQEMKAYQELLAVIKKAEETKALYEAAGLPLPEPLRRLFMS